MMISQQSFWLGAVSLAVFWKIINWVFAKVKGKQSLRHKCVAMLWRWHANILRLALATDQAVYVYDKVSSNKIANLAEDSAKKAVEIDFRLALK